MTHQDDYSSYLSERWSSSDGSVTLGTDSRLNFTYTWMTNEILAADYRLLFGSPLAISERPTHLNSYIIDPRNESGLHNWFLHT